VDVLAFGSVFLEMVFGTIPGLPGPGEEIYTDEFAISCGGAISVASAASAVGAQAALVSVLGDDLGSRVVEAHCVRQGVDLSASRRVAGPTSGVTVVLNFDGDRAFISHLPEASRMYSNAVQAAETIQWWNEAVAELRPTWIYLHASEEVVPVIREARRLGCHVAVDTELGTIGRSPDLVRKCASIADLFVPNRRELACLTGTDELAASIAAVGAPDTTIVVKQGGEGAVFAIGGQLVAVTDGVEDVEVKDRTGAGDSFAGAMIGALALGADVTEAVIAGNAAGSRAVARLGAIGAVSI
jgi:sugar/nucleoside kinase (ribokinase family)